MIRSLVLAAVGFAAVAAAPAIADPYVDYTPEKGVWEVTAVEVDPNHVDEYLAGLRRTILPGMEVMKRRGMIDAYRFRVRNGFAKGNANVLLETHYVSIAMLAPDKARDQAIEKELLAGLSKEDGMKAVAGYEKYRTMLDTGYWSEVTLAK